ncbi:MAG: TIGR02300 family protein, partial [Hyphomonadaceae bacterium]
MVKAELGDKQICPNCGAKFYDLRKRPAVCPKCQTAFDPSDETVKLKRVRARQPAYEPAYDDDEPASAKREEDSEEDEAEEAPEIDADA